MTENAYEHWDRATEFRDDGAFQAAADSFTLAAHERFAASNYVEPPFERSAPQVAFALYSLLAAGVYYRVSANQDRCTNRCRCGILHCEDLRDAVVSYDAQKGMMWEYIGDFRTIAQLDDRDAAYERAAGYYEDIENPIQWQAEPEFEVNMTFLFDLVDSIDLAIDRRKKQAIKAESLEERIEFKLSTFPRVVAEFSEQERD